MYFCGHIDFTERLLLSALGSLYLHSSLSDSPKEGRKWVVVAEFSALSVHVCAHRTPPNHISHTFHFRWVKLDGYETSAKFLSLRLRESSAIYWIHSTFKRGKFTLPSTVIRERGSFYRALTTLGFCDLTRVWEESEEDFFHSVCPLSNDKKK